MSYDSTNYLSRLPEEFRYLGNHEKNEIEIATDPKVISSLIEKHRERRESSKPSQMFLSIDSGKIGIVFEDEYVLVVRDPVIFKNGSYGTYLRIFERPVLTGKAGVVILPVRDNYIYFNRIFRHATRKWELELPRGYRESDKSLEDTVKTELLQEVGLEIETIQDIGEIKSNTGILAGTAQAYFVGLQAGDAQPMPEQSESISGTITLVLEEVREKIRKGEIHDAFTLSALQLAQAHNLLNF